MISSRFLPAVCVLAGISLVPTLIHSYAGPQREDGLSTRLIPTVLAGRTGSPTDRAGNWGERRFDSHDWMERTYVDGTSTVRLTVVRSYDPKTLYHHPELATSYGVPFTGTATERLPERPDVPVHILRPGPGVRTLAVYALHYDGRFVEDPILFQVRTALELLVSRRKPMTLFFAQDDDPGRVEQVSTSAVADVLFGAIDHFTADHAVASE